MNTLFLGTGGNEFLGTGGNEHFVPGNGRE